MLNKRYSNPLRGVMLCYLVLLSSAAGADPEQVDSRALDLLLAEVGSLSMFNGSVIVDRGGVANYRRDVGLSDYALNTSITALTRYRIASLSKLYTDAVVASLVEKGVISLDSTLDQWLPEFPGAGLIQIQNIVDHSSGIPHTNAQPWGDGSETFSKDEIVSRLAQLPLDFEPGSERSYSNGGYAVLVVALETATKLSWPDLLNREVLVPLNLDDTGVIADSRAVIPNMARGYEPGPTHGSRRESRFYAVEMRPGGGDLFATTNDALAFFAAIWRGEFAGDTGKAMFRDGETKVATGRSPGFSSAAMYQPEDDLLIVSLGNNYAADFNWVESLAALALGKEGFISEVPKLARQPWEANPGMLGLWRYENERFSQELRIGQNPDGSMYIDDSVTKTRSALLPLADGGYVETLYFGRCEWLGEEQDRIRCARWYPEGFVADFVRR